MQNYYFFWLFLESLYLCGSKLLSCGVMVAHQILVLLVRVRVLAGQRYKMLIICILDC